MIYCFLADGFEEIEALATVDILRRAGLDVATVSVSGDTASGSHNITVKADLNISSFKIDDTIDGVILPGGMPGVTNLEKTDAVKSVVEYCMSKNLPVCAICAAPSLLGHMGLLSSKNATCFPGFETELNGANIKKDKVVEDGNIITARGAGCTFDFAFAIITKLIDKKTAESIAQAMQYKEQ